jgi:hypothetical protein
MKTVPNAQARQVEDNIRASQRVKSCVFISNVSLDDAHTGIILMVGKVLAFPVHEVVEYEDRVRATGKEPIDKVAADESRSSGHEDSCST